MNKKLLEISRIGLICTFLPGLALAQHDAGIPQIDDIEGLYPGKAYSPYAQRAFPSQLYWGETHVLFRPCRFTCQPCLRSCRDSTN